MTSPTEADTTNPPAPPPATRPRARWGAILKRSLHEVKRDELPDRAAALTFYGVLSIFPAALVLVALLGAGQRPACGWA